MTAVLPRPTENGPAQALVRVGSAVLVWAVYAALLLPYVAIRGVCDAVFEARDIEGVERTLFLGNVPTVVMQGSIHGDVFWTLGFLTHLSWFFLPLLWGMVVIAQRRDLLVEYFFWLLLASYLSTISFFLIPVEPPWMQAGVDRILVEHGLFDYAGVDDNPVASLPSLHAGLPMVIALFFLLRMRRPRLAGIIAAHGLLIGAGVVYLGEHWMIDVAGGWVLAGLVAWLCTSPGARSLASRVPGRPVERVGRAGAWLMSRGQPAGQIVPFTPRREESVA